MLENIQLDLFPNQSTQAIILGDCLEEMRKMANDSVDCIVTDCPYGLCFMGKKWDKKVPGEEYWKEALRICKPGSFLLAAGAPRSHHHLAIAIENAGWEITDCIMHIFGSGFPKGKSQLKPAYEPWVLARKKADKCKHLNIDECRIPTDDKLGGGQQNADSIGKIHEGWQRPWMQDEQSRINHAKKVNENVEKAQKLGRWPANVIFDEEAGEMLDQQSGTLKSGELKPYKSTCNLKERGWGFSQERDYTSSSNSGGASRFFYCAKASSNERNAGLEKKGLQNLQGQICKVNSHPTVKPLKLMEYLIKLVIPLNGLLLDPFLGSGTTLIAAKKLGINAMGIEINPAYVEIAKNRLNHQI